MRNLSCGSGLEPSSKFRHHLTHAGLYQNVPRGTLRPIAMDYTLPNCLGRSSTSTASIIHPHHSLWQERHHLRTPMSCIGVDRKPPSSRGRICSIVLAIASFVVLVIVLAIAGLALYMGISNTEGPANAIISFGCSAKVIKGDRFAGNLEEKAQKYKRQIELLYQRSALGPALLSCAVDRFGKDAATIFFKLSFNRRKLVENLTNIEKAIRDIFLSDAFSKKPIFRNIRFDSKSILVKQLQEGASVYSAPSAVTSPPPSFKSNVKSGKMGVVLKSPKNMTVSPSTTSSKPIIKDEPEFNEEDLPVIQGSFKISKTEADITEKKTEAPVQKVKIEKTTSAPTKKTTFKESSVTSALYKIAGDKTKVGVTATTTTSTTTTSTKTPVTTKQAATTTSSTTTTSTTTTSRSTTVPIKEFKGSPEIYNDEPWIPILPNIPVYPSKTVPINDYNQPSPPTYTSFTNPGLSYHFQEAEQLGTTGIKIHPIPVNKIPFTKPFVDLTTTETSKQKQTPTEITTDFVNIKYQAENEYKKDEEYGIKNISSIFYDLASSLDTENITIVEHEDYEPDLKNIAGQGHVEVVEVDMEELLGQTTKIPLVTLLPVRSNSGIGRPFNRKRFGDSNNLSVENRSFPSHAVKQTLDTFEKPKNKSKTVPEPVNISSADNYHIMGILNFATERYNGDEQTKQQDIVRFPKMEQDVIRNNSRHPLPAYPASNFLSPEQIKELSEISKINNNDTYFQTQALISTKAISSSTYSNGLNVLTKTFNKIQNTPSKNENTTYNKIKLKTDCDEFSFKCGDGKCLSESTKCNQLIDCPDGSDEKNCNCADYLKSQLLLNKICDGVVDCWDFSDENQCEWCTPDKYVCSNSKVCINEEQICDGVKDCPQGDDERQCVTIANDTTSASEFPYYSQGYLMVRKHGQWGKLCVDNFQNVVSKSSVAWEITDLGKAICKSMTYQKMTSIESIQEKNEEGDKQKYFELAYSTENSSRSNLSFKETYCPSKKIVKVTCQSLECGARPQAVKHIARVVGGGNAELGAWPWQVALYKEGEFQCGATLLSDRWLVSAGHCFYRSPNEHWVARLGALRRGTTLPSPYEQLRTISRIIVHPGYLDFGFINDISLLEMSSSVVFSDYVRPVCLPSSDQHLDDGRMCTVIGWGQLFEVGRIFPDTLQEVQVPVISTAECRKRTLFLPLYKITEDMFCAGYERGGRDACLGDSGGPLMCSELNGRWTLYGITSNGYGCARANRPGVYTKVINYIDWINFYVHGDDSRLKNITKISTSCSGHRCPLGECLPETRLCNGFIECSDASDEKNCQKTT
ncbi:uncharacterized protein LOC143197460 isoform X2 [Rhynchophorus ferrugineus]|uniref:uncharacterized protein LOC143197460 isoform X2 n=1 Tax=Rhynchophorus ferrugineus TaxID=354439 RepID=UPI003FCCA363